MAYNKNTRQNNVSPQGKGNPSDTGKEKAQIKDPKNLTKEEMEEEQRIREEYTDGTDQPSTEKTQVKNINRNTDKPGIDNGKYN
jgi:hypothetical protein